MPAPAAGSDASGDTASVYGAGTVGAVAQEQTVDRSNNGERGAVPRRNRRSRGIRPGRLWRALAIFESMPMKAYLIGKTIEEAVTSLREATKLYVEEQLDTELQWPGVSVRERPGVS